MSNTEQMEIRALRAEAELRRARDLIWAIACVLGRGYIEEVSLPLEIYRDRIAGGLAMYGINTKQILNWR